MTKLRIFVVAVSLLFAATQLSHAQHWVPLVNQPNVNLALNNPLLLTDGTVMLHEYCGAHWWRLTPDAFGNYVKGTWKRLAAMPAGYVPLYFGSAVLPDGRVMVAGGEYNNCQPVPSTIQRPICGRWSRLRRAGRQSATRRASS